MKLCLTTRPFLIDLASRKLSLHYFSVSTALKTCSRGNSADTRRFTHLSTSRWKSVWCQDSVSVRPHRGTLLRHKQYYSSQNSSVRSPPPSVMSSSSNRTIKINDTEYSTDEWTNVTARILGLVGRNLHLQKDHPICLLKEIIVNHFYAKYRKPRGPIFAVCDNLNPVVTVEQNFDQLLTPKDHVSRRQSDNYYINKKHLLRAHTTAHELDLIRSGLNAFLTVGDVYRRDSIDSTHFPVFHQMEGVRLYNKSQLFCASDEQETLNLFEDGEETHDKQACHTLEASKLVELDLKQTLLDCMKELFGQDMQYRWVDAFFPFTHPSFELEIKYKDEWIEMLGCGVLKQEILDRAGASDNIAWAFGVGLERVAMKLYNVPDIRYFWSTSEVFLSQFRGQPDIKAIEFKPFTSKQPLVANDISFWIPDNYNKNDFYDLIRSFDSDIVELVSIIDEFTHPKTGRTSHCYRLFYRHPTRALTQEEVTKVHEAIKRAASEHLGVDGRW